MWKLNEDVQKGPRTVHIWHTGAQEVLAIINTKSDIKNSNCTAQKVSLNVSGETLVNNHVSMFQF